MNRLLKTTSLAACLFLTLTHLQAGNCETAQKTLTKSFPVSGATTLKIDNVFGAITISEWDKNEISFTVTIKATTKKQSTSQELVDKVAIDFKQEKEVVSAKTTCPSQKDKCNCTYKIEYQVHVPRNIHYDLNGKYGNITMENATGNVNVTLMYGDFSGNEFAGNSKINISYGKLSVNKLSGTNDEVTGMYGKSLSVSESKSLKVNVKHSKLFIGTLERLSIESAHTDVQILKVDKIQLSSSYGKYEIGEVNEMVSDGKNSWYTKFEINRLTGAFSFPALSYGSVTIHNVMPTFDNIVINANYTPIKMTLDAATSCKLESLVSGDRCNRSDIQVNAFKSNLSTLSSNNAKSVSGTLGDKEAPKAVIKIKSDNSNININQL
ncbi:MAG: hypothetical protein FWG84_08995 [Bacteroidales bacterium]|nr:hypothetical protein [Bacteroidales bacterium]